MSDYLFSTAFPAEKPPEHPGRAGRELEVQNKFDVMIALDARAIGDDQAGREGEKKLKSLDNNRVKKL